MSKEIPISQEKSTPAKNTKAERLREASRRLEALPLSRPPTTAEWDEATGELTADDLTHLKKLAVGYRERALEPVEAPWAEHLEEAASALLLWPQDAEWAQQTLELYRQAGWQAPEAQAFLGVLGQRIRKKRKSFLDRRWIMPLLIALVAVPSVLGALYVLGVGWSRASGISPVQGPRNLEAVFDTQGLKANIQIAESRMLLFPDATVAELSAWVTFPDHRVEVWEGSVDVLDAQGQVLTRREVAFRSSSEGPLEAGQGVAVFEQFNAYPFFDRVTSFQVVTSRILAREAHPRNRQEMPLEGLESLASGYNLKVWLLEGRWSDRFASKVHTAAFELENTGLKPFAELQFSLVWRDGKGKVLKTITFRPVSPFRTALPSGARLPWNQESVFDTEVFSWSPGEEPHPVLELTKWQ